MSTADPLFSVEGKVVIVIGGLGQTGAEFVRALHDRGAKVAVFGRSSSAASATDNVGDLASSDRLSFHAVDIT